MYKCYVSILWYTSEGKIQLVKRILFVVEVIDTTDPKWIILVFVESYK